MASLPERVRLCHGDARMGMGKTAHQQQNHICGMRYAAVEIFASGLVPVTGFALGGVHGAEPSLGFRSAFLAARSWAAEFEARASCEAIR